MAVVGGGIMGLSTALHAARIGLSVRVVDARNIGEGASGLNGGQVIPGLKYDPEWLLEHFGARARRGADRLRRLDGRRGLRPDPRRKAGGAVCPQRLDPGGAHRDRACAPPRSRDRQWRARGADVRLLDAAEIAEMTGARGYVGGWLDRRAGVIDPLAYTLELARIAKAAGARIAEREKATALRRDGGVWRLSHRVRRRKSARSRSWSRPMPIPTG